ncbi:MAG: hypothetical protein PHV28_10530 [Kiritimatiellae bacterium]|nr:hypothetical protein [Kiritimatiellia bacterium]
MRTSLLIAAVLFFQGLRASETPVAWVWQEPGLRARPVELRAALQAAGFEAHGKDSASLSAAGALHKGRPDLLALPYGGMYPAGIADSLEGFCRQGGALLVTGGADSFRRPVYHTSAGPRELTDATEVLAACAAGTVWRAALVAAGDHAQARWQDEVLRVSLDVTAYAYVGTEIAPPETPDAVLELQVRGVSGTTLLSLDFQEKDGARWKHIIPVTQEWTTHRVHLAEFLPYNRKERGTGAEMLDARRVSRFLAGLTRSMAGRTDNVFELRGVRLLRAEVTGAQIAAWPRFADSETAVARWFGSRDVGKSRDLTLPGASDGARQEYAGGSLTLLQAGSLKGGRLAVFDHALGTDGLANENAGKLADAARALTAGIWMRAPQPRFRVDEGRVVMDVGLTMINPTARAADITVTLHTNNAEAVTLKINLPARQRAATDLALAKGLDPPRLETAPLRLRVEARSSAGPVLGPRVFRLDARGQLREICDFMLSRSLEDGKMHGHSFIDNRGARVLAGAYDIFGDRRYLDAAMRWGGTMMAEQRGDGGYRMGYGITAHGEECYVADGGEIVVGVLRLAAYAEGDLRARLLESADRYMAYREGFRVPTGGIGVGWCLHDFARRPLRPLKTITRVYAPENNTYTIGCSLAGAYGHAALRGDPALKKRAQADADWLMPRAKRLNGAFIESFMFAHEFAATPERRVVYADFIRKSFITPLLEKPSEWWLGGAGRHALNLDGLVYCMRRIDSRPEIRAEVYRALCAMFSPDMPRSVPAVITGQALGHPEWLYISYGTLGLVDAVAPLASVDRWR